MMNEWTIHSPVRILQWFHPMGWYFSVMSVLFLLLLLPFTIFPRWWTQLKIAPPDLMRSTDPNEWPTQTTQKNKTERVPKEVILWDHVLPSLLKTLSCLDDNLLNIYHMTLSGARTKAFCHSVESKLEGRQVWAPSILKLGEPFIIWYNKSQEGSPMCVT